MNSWLIRVAPSSPSSSDLNTLRRLRDKAMETALTALATEFGFRRMFEPSFEIVCRVPTHEQATAIRRFTRTLPRLSDRRAVRDFLALAEKVWELESEAAPLPTVCHRGCPQD